jgi:nitroimidazol reductase NimA-like FMN-containing flavoprotein (pyridoxamine 5'-phosphate oxidase superfamily)
MKRTDDLRAARKLGKAEVLQRLASVPFGRVVFTRRALPAIRPVNHVVLDGRIIICSHEGAAIAGVTGSPAGAVVVYEADDFSAEQRLGWSVVITGRARIVDDPGEAARCRGMMHSWLAGDTGYVIQIEPEIVTGFELCRAGPAAA